MNDKTPLGYAAPLARISQGALRDPGLCDTTALRSEWPAGFDPKATRQGAAGQHATRRRFLRHAAGGSLAVLGGFTALPRPNALAQAPTSQPQDPSRAGRPLYDILIRNGDVLDPGRNFRARADVAVRDGKIARIASGLPANEAVDVVDASGMYVTPGLIDLHTHCYFACSESSVEADAIAPRTGVTTWIDAGSCDVKTYRGFRRFIADQSQARIFGFIYAYPRAVDLNVNPLASATAQIDATGAAVRENRDLLLGVKVQLGYNMQGQWTEGLADVGREICDRSGLRMMMHVSYSPPETEFALQRLKPGDVMTHAFTGHGLKIVDDQGKLKPGVREARERGVLFDIGHGMGSFSFDVGRACLDQDFSPDTISSDIHQGSINGPAFDLPTTMSKFHYLGMPFEECILRTTANAAKILEDRVPGLGSLQEGGPADIALFQIEDGEFTLVDAMKQRVTAKRRIINRLTICRGRRMLPRV